MTAPLRLRLDGGALVDNWRALAALSGDAACGAAVKADGYGLGAREVVVRLAEAGCRDFFVATWAEAAALAPLGVTLSVLHGVRAEDMAAAAAAISRMRAMNMGRLIGSIELTATPGPCAPSTGHHHEHRTAADWKTVEMQPAYLPYTSTSM